MKTIAALVLLAAGSTGDLYLYLFPDQLIPCVLGSIALEPAGLDFVCRPGDTNGDGVVDERDDLAPIFGPPEALPVAPSIRGCEAGPWSDRPLGAYWVEADVDGWSSRVPVCVWSRELGELADLHVVLRGLPAEIFADGFESGDLGEWSP